MQSMTWLHSQVLLLLSTSSATIRLLFLVSIKCLIQICEGILSSSYTLRVFCDCLIIKNCLHCWFFGTEAKLPFISLYLLSYFLFKLHKLGQCAANFFFGILNPCLQYFYRFVSTYLVCLLSLIGHVSLSLDVLTFYFSGFLFYYFFL